MSSTQTTLSESINSANDVEPNECDDGEFAEDEKESSQNGDTLATQSQAVSEGNELEASTQSTTTQAQATTVNARRERPVRAKSFKDTVIWNEARRKERQWLTRTFFGGGVDEKRECEPITESPVEGEKVEKEGETEENEGEKETGAPQPVPEEPSSGFAFVDTFRHFYPTVSKYTWWDPVTFSRLQNMGTSH